MHCNMHRRSVTKCCNMAVNYNLVHFPFQRLHLSARLMTGWSVGTLASMKQNVSTGGAVGVQLESVVSHGVTMRKVIVRFSMLHSYMLGTAAIFVPTALGAQCQTDPSDRTRCGYLGISGEQCKASGCCWSPTSSSGRPWCFLNVTGKLHMKSMPYCGS